MVLHADTQALFGIVGESKQILLRPAFSRNIERRSSNSNGLPMHEEEVCPSCFVVP